ncbi:MAG: DUF1007 family protein [Pseudomonadota bacterium]
MAVLVLLFDLRVADAHPHVFVDGGVSFVLDDHGALTALEVTWHYDLFETLYALSSLDILPEPDGSLSPENRQRISDFMTDWPEGFGGSAHLSISDQKYEVSRPTSMEVSLIKGNLVMRFHRHLAEPVAMAGRTAEVGFYEATYFYAFTATKTPRIHGADAECTADLIPFDPDVELEALQVSLFDLGREDTPETPNIGSLFADRIVLECD